MKSASPRGRCFLGDRRFIRDRDTPSQEFRRIRPVAGGGRTRPRARGCMMTPLMSSPAAVAVHGLVHDYGASRVLRGVDFTVGQAESRVDRLSGGLMRRAEIAKGLLHRPRLLLMDEPSSGLDPGARQDLWDLLRELRERFGTTLLLTTHLMEEADRCDRLAILSEGTLVAVGTPRALKSEIGGDVIVIATGAPAEVCDGIESRFGGPVQVVDGTVRLERPRGHELIPRIVEAFADRIDAVTL